MLCVSHLIFVCVNPANSLTEGGGAGLLSVTSIKSCCQGIWTSYLCKRFSLSFAKCVILINNKLDTKMN